MRLPADRRHGVNIERGKYAFRTDVLNLKEKLPLVVIELKAT
jgi:hypothetical protein